MRMHALFYSRLHCFRRPLSRALLLVGLILFSFVSARAAAEVIVQNDSIPPVGVRVIDLPVGFRLAARLTSPIEGTIVGVQILWGSESGLAPLSQETAIRVSSFNVNPYAPAATLATIAAPILQDGAVNEFRFLDPATNLIPLAVPISAGTDFFVDLELANNYGDGPNSPGILMDTGIPQFQRNSMKLTNNPNWFDFSLGVLGAGDLGIRAIIQPVPEPSTYALAAVGMIGLLAFRRRKAAA